MAGLRLAVGKGWPAVIGLCLAMLVALAGLQLRWTGQFSKMQEESLLLALENSVAQFEREIGRELGYLLTLFQARGYPRPSGLPPNLRTVMRRWVRTSQFSQFLRRVLVYSRGGSLVVALSPGGSRSEVSERQAGLGAVREHLDMLAQRAPALTVGDSRWWLFPSEGMVCRRLFLAPAQSAERVLRAASADRAYLILELDWPFAVSSALPNLVARNFSDANGETLYQLAIVDRQSGRMLYKSDGSIDRRSLEAADVRRPLRVVRSRGLRNAESSQPRNSEFGSPQESRDGDQVLDGGAAEGLANGPSWLWRERPVVQADGSPVDLEVLAWHVSGSLESVVRTQRRRSLALGFGGLLILGLAVALLIVSASRSSHLAKMQMDFVAGVSHELRTPVSVICSAGENLADGIVGRGGQTRRYGELIRDQGRRLAAMVEQTLQFAAMRSREQRIEPVELDVGLAVRDAVKQAQPAIDQAGFSVDVVSSDELPRVVADPSGLQQILANLLSNAVKYGRPGRWVRVTARQRSRYAGEVWVEVADGGLGIPASERERIFEPFFRGAVASSGSVQGFGLGLKLARDLAAAMGARISLRSRPDQGTVFAVRLPVASKV